MKTIVKQVEPPIPAEVIATSIVKVADGVERLMKSGLTDKGLLILISHASGVPQTTVKNVLRGMNDLRRLYLTASKPSKEQP